VIRSYSPELVTKKLLTVNRLMDALAHATVWASKGRAKRPHDGEEWMQRGLPLMMKLCAAVAFLAIASCSPGVPQRQEGQLRDLTNANRSYQEDLVGALVEAQPGTVIEIPAGVFVIDSGLALNVDGVTLRGAGMDKTVLSFRGQTGSAQGLLVTASNFTIEDLAIEDAPGDGLKITDGENIIIRRVRAEWTGGPATENGAYGLYPVQVRNLLVEDCVAIGASDAGIYVGQSQNVVVRRNRATHNVAGIEIENTVDADVYENVATENTGGILVFNMPQLEVTGARTRVYNNRVFANNTANFAHAGTPVASVPAGTGVIINANDQVEIFDNDLADNNTANIVISSLYSTGYAEAARASGFDAYPESILIMGNRFSGGGSAPDGLELQALRVAVAGPMGRLPDVLWDGYVDGAKLVDGQVPEALRICLDNGEAGIVNADGPNGYRNPSMDRAAHACTLPRLPAVVLPW
jgi:parallel beta-helix repeat protein